MHRFLSWFLMIFILGGCGKTLLAYQAADSVVITTPEYGTYQDRETPPIRFERIRKFPPEESDSYQIYSVSALTTDSLGNIYFFDDDLSQLVCLSPDGALKWRTGQEGKGPGDFNFTKGIAIDGQFVYVSNQSGYRIDTYSLDGSYLTTHTLDQDYSFATLVGFIAPNHLVLSKPLRGRIGNKIFTVPTKDRTKIAAEFDMVLTDFELPENMPSNLGVTVFGDSLLAGSVTEYSFQVYNLEGTLLRKVIRRGNRIDPPKVETNGPNTSVYFDGSVAPPLVLPEGHYLVKSGWHSEEAPQYAKGAPSDNVNWSSIDLFSPKGEILYSLETTSEAARFRNILHIDREGYLYASCYNEQDELQIIKYKVHINL